MLSVIDTLIVSSFLGFMIFLGLRQKFHAQNTNGLKDSQYLLGGRALTLPAFIATTVSTWYGGILGVGEYAWTYGISNWIVFGVPYYIGALLFALLLSKRARSAESLTIPQRFESCYGPTAARCAGILIFLTTIPGAYMLIMGTLCECSFGISSAWGIIISAFFTVLYLWRGGFKSVVRTDALQMALMFGSFLILTFWLIMTYGKAPLETLPDTHLSPTGGQDLGSILIWYIIALSTLAEPNFFQRCFAAKTPQIARNGLLISIVFWIVFDFMTTLCGLYARALLPDLSNPLHAFPALAAQVLPIGLIGIFFAGLFATVLSTLDSNLFTTASTIGRDLWPSSADESSLTIARRTRIGLIIGGIGAAAIALSAGSVVQIWKMFGSVSAASLLIPILTTYYNKIKMTAKGASILMILSALTTIAWFAWRSASGTLLLGLEPLLAGGSVAAVCFAVDQICQKMRHSSYHSS